MDTRKMCRDYVKFCKKKSKRKWYKNLEWTDFLNFFILQWFFVRLQPKIKILGGYTFLYFIWPLTGWWVDYKWLWRKKVR